MSAEDAPTQHDDAPDPETAPDVEADAGTDASADADDLSPAARKVRERIRDLKRQAKDATERVKAEQDKPLGDVVWDRVQRWLDEDL